MFEDQVGYGGYAVGQYAPGHNPEYQKRLGLFNLARSLFPYNNAPDAKAVKTSDVIKAAQDIESYLSGEPA